MKRVEIDSSSAQKRIYQVISLKLKDLASERRGNCYKACFVIDYPKPVTRHTDPLLTSSVTPHPLGSLPFISQDGVPEHRLSNDGLQCSDVG